MATPYNFDDPSKEDALFAELERKRTKAREFQATPELAERVGEISRTYPNLKPGVVMGLAKAGKTSKDPVTIAASTKSGPLKRGLKATTRTLFTALDSLFEEGVKRPLRALTAASSYAAAAGEPVYGIPERLSSTYAQAGESAGIKALRALARGEDVDLGTRFFPGGKLQEQAKKEQETLSFEGEPISTGRTIAHVVTEPGTGAHKLLSGLLDFTVAIGADPSAVAGGAVGKVQQAKKTFTGAAELAPNIRKLAQSAGLVKATRKTVLSDQVDVWLKSKQGQDVVNKIAKTDKFDDVWKALGKKVDVKTATQLADAKTADEVLEVLRPKLGIELREKPTFKAIEGIRKRKESIRLLSQMPGEHFDLSDIDNSVEQLDRLQKAAKLTPEQIAANNEVLARSGSTIEAADAIFETSKQIAEKVVSKGGTTSRARELTSFFPENTRDLVKFFVDEIGENVPVTGAVIDGAGKALPSPHLLMEYTRSIPMLNVRELRRATSKFPNLWTDPKVKMTANVAAALTEKIWRPLVLIRGAWTVRVVGEEQARMAFSGLDSAFSHPASWISYVAGRKGKTDVLGKDFDPLDDASEFARSLSQRKEALDPTGYRRVQNKVLIRKGEETYNRAWSEEINQLATDPVAREVAGKPLEEVKEWFWSGAGQKFRKEMAEASRRDDLLNQNVADEYIDSIVKRIDIKTKGNQELREVIATGRADKDLINRLDGLDGPDIVKGDQFLRVKEREELSQKLDKMVDSMMNSLMTVPTNKLSRSVTFKQAYGQRIDELKKVSANLTDEEMDIVAKGYALDFTKKLLYDLSEKNQFFDITRAIFPFGNAWAEVLTRWAKIGTERPQTIRRFQQGVEGAEGSGFFYPDDSTGEEMFAYPGGEALTKALLGVPVRLEGRLEGLSLMGQAMPGLGPVVSIPVGKLIPDKPKYDDFKDFVLPFGEANLKGGVLESQLPGYMKRFISALREDEFGDRVYANTVGDVANYLVATGDYSLGSQNEQNRLLEDAKKKARNLFFIRGLMQFVAPTGPQPKFLAEDKDGKMHTATLLAQDLRRMYQEDPETATKRFLERYGENAYLYMQPKSRDLIPGIPVTKDGTKWVRDNSDIEKSFPSVFGLFAPEGGEFDFEAYNRYLETGSKERLLPKERFNLANHRLASMIYEEAKDKVGDSPDKEQLAWLREIKEALMEEYPGYSATDLERKKKESLILELKAASKNPKLAKTDAGKGLAIYLEARDRALEEAKSRDLASFKSANAARDLRDWLREIAFDVQQEHPGFSRIWDLVLENELKRDEPLEVEEEDEDAA